MAGSAAEIIGRCARGELPANVALMHLLMEAPSPEAAEAALATALGRAGGEARARLGALRILWREHPEAWRVVRGVIGGVDHAGAGAGVAAVAAAFDRVADHAPEAGSALYALGDPALLARATDEVVGWLRARRLLGPARRVLDIGCGAGRFEAALAGEARHVTGIDVSARMIRAAGERLAGLPNVRVIQVDGRDLAAFAAGSFNLVLAVDSFPYLVQAGPDVAEAHLRDAARVLAPGGDLVVLNYSYRGDPDRDRLELAAHAAAHGFSVEAAGERPFRLWDGLAFHLRKTT